MADWVKDFKKKIEQEQYFSVRQDILNKEMVIERSLTKDVIKRFAHEGIEIYGEDGKYRWTFCDPVPYGVPCKD